MIKEISQLKDKIEGCRLCEERSLIPSANPILQLSPKAKIGIFGQAPGNLAHQSGRPFTDPSGVRLREWMGVSESQFYDQDKFVILPMAFCFPGYDGKGKNGKGGDRPPPKLCATTWRETVMDSLNHQLSLVLLIGSYAQKWHLGPLFNRTLTETVSNWRKCVDYAQEQGGPIMLPMPHPSWRNNGWIRKHTWFSAELLPFLQNQISEELGS